MSAGTKVAHHSGVRALGFRVMCAWGRVGEIHSLPGFQSCLKHNSAFRADHDHGEVLGLNGECLVTQIVSRTDTMHGI